MTPEAPSGALVVSSAWVDADMALDPLPEHRPAEIVCEPLSVIPQYGFLDVSTDACNYVLVTQPLGADIAPGEAVLIESGHLTLFAPEGPASGHMALSIAGELVWERIVPIPSEAEVYTDTVVVEQGASAGDPVVFHLHNHGANEWRFFGVWRAGEQ